VADWQWHQLGRTQICTSLKMDNHARTAPLNFFTGRMPFLLLNQQCQNAEGKNELYKSHKFINNDMV